MAAFTLNDILKEPVAPGAKAEPRMRISYISSGEIVPDGRNEMYSMDDIEFLKTSIEQVGLQQPLVVSAVEDGTYRIVSGHRRFEALKLLKWENIPCVLDAEKGDLEGQLALVLANATGRDMTDYDKVMQYGRLKEILTAMKKETGKAGKVRDMIQQSLNISTGQAARYEVILKYGNKYELRNLKDGSSTITWAYENADARRKYELANAKRKAEQDAAAKVEAARLRQLAADGTLPLTESQITATIAAGFLDGDDKRAVADRLDDGGNFELRAYLKDEYKNRSWTYTELDGGIDVVTACTEKSVVLSAQGHADTSFHWMQLAVYISNILKWHPKQKAIVIDWKNAGHIVLRNDGERRAFAEGYENWGVWLSIPEMGAVHYRYALPDGNYLLASVFEKEPNEYSGDKHLEYRYWEGKYFPIYQCRLSGICEILGAFKEV